MKEIYDIIAFDSTHCSIAADKLLSEKGFSHKLIPTPQVISAGCGFCLRLPAEEAEAAKCAISEKEIGISGLYRAQWDGLKIAVLKAER